MWIVPIVVLVLGQPPHGQAADLVNRLASARFAERDAAAAELEGMGTDALPALHAISKSNDPDLRTRVESLLEKIRMHSMTSASQIRLNFKDRPFDDILGDSETQSPNRLAWHPDTPQSVRRQPVTLSDSSPLAFWCAMDRLCQAGNLYYIPGLPAGPGSGTAQFRLFLAPGTVACPRSDTGPLRFELTGISHFRTVNLIPNPKVEPDAPLPAPSLSPLPFGQIHDDFHVAVRMLVEPRMLISRIGQALIVEAVDDRGQSLLPGDEPSLQACGGGSIPAQACTFIRLSLKHPAHAGNMIKRLRLTIPVEVVSRKPDPLVIPLARVQGKTFRHGHTSVQIVAINTDSSGHPSIELQLAMDDEFASRVTHALPLEPPLVWPQFVRPEVSANVIQFFDSQGRQFPWSGTGDYQAGGPWVKAKLTLWPEGGPPVGELTAQGIVNSKQSERPIPTELHYYELAQAVVRANVEFADIPLP
jgi:hypothetical protein